MKHIICRIQECFLANELLKDYLLDELYDEDEINFENYKSCYYCSFDYKSIVQNNRLIKNDLILREKKLAQIELTKMYAMVICALLVITSLGIYFVLF